MAGARASRDREEPLTPYRTEDLFDYLTRARRLRLHLFDVTEDNQDLLASGDPSLETVGELARAYFRSAFHTLAVDFVSDCIYVYLFFRVRRRYQRLGVVHVGVRGPTFDEVRAVQFACIRVWTRMQSGELSVDADVDTIVDAVRPQVDPVINHLLPRPAGPSGGRTTPEGQR